MHDNNETSRLLISIKLLSYLYAKNHYVKGREISDTFNMSERSIRRLISDLRDAGYDIESVSGRYGGYKLNRSNILLPISLTPDQHQYFQEIENTIKSADINHKEEVINLLNQISIQSQLKSNSSFDIYVTKKLLEERIQHIEQVQNVLTDAMSTLQRVEIKYQSFNKDKQDIVWQEFRPQQFQIFNQIPYIKGYYDNSSSSFRTLRLSRFIDIRLINKKYSFNEDFNFDNDNSAFSKAIFKTYDVILKVYKGNHDILDYEYGDHQEIIEHDDHYILKFKLAGDQIIKDLVLSMSIHCELIEPANIRDDLRREISIINKRYKEEYL